MINCAVLRCQDPGFSFVTGGHKSRDFYEAYVCAGHKALIEAGYPWDMHGGHVLMGQDMAPTLERWSARASVGTEGFTLTLESADHIKPFEVFLSPADARMLAAFINAPYCSPLPDFELPWSANGNNG